MATEEEVRRWVREEQELIVAENQAACTHSDSGTLLDGILTCDRCEKVITLADADSPSRTNSAHPRIPLQR